MDEAAERWPETKTWFRNKRADWVLAGMTTETSKIPVEWRRNVMARWGDP